jgi:hypothetical protein
MVLSWNNPGWHEPSVLFVQNCQLAVEGSPIIELDMRLPQNVPLELFSRVKSHP